MDPINSSYFHCLLNSQILNYYAGKIREHVLSLALMSVPSLASVCLCFLDTAAICLSLVADICFADLYERLEIYGVCNQLPQ